MAQSGGGPKERWLSRLPLLLVGRGASPQDKSHLPGGCLAPRSAERRFLSWDSQQLGLFSSNASFCFCGYTAAQELPLFPHPWEAPHTWLQLPQKGRMKAGVRGWEGSWRWKEEEEETASLLVRDHCGAGREDFHACCNGNLVHLSQGCIRNLACWDAARAGIKRFAAAGLQAGESSNTAEGRYLTFLWLNFVPSMWSCPVLLWEGVRVGCGLARQCLQIQAERLQQPQLPSSPLTLPSDRGVVSPLSATLPLVQGEDNNLSGFP